MIAIICIAQCFVCAHVFVFLYFWCVYMCLYFYTFCVCTCVCIFVSLYFCVCAMRAANIIATWYSMWCVTYNFVLVHSTSWLCFNCYYISVCCKKMKIVYSKVCYHIIIVLILSGSLFEQIIVKTISKIRLWDTHLIDIQETVGSGFLQEKYSQQTSLYHDWWTINVMKSWTPINGNFWACSVQAKCCTYVSSTHSVILGFMTHKISAHISQLLFNTAWYGRALVAVKSEWSIQWLCRI